MYSSILYIKHIYILYTHICTHGISSIHIYIYTYIYMYICVYIYRCVKYIKYIVSI